MTRLSDMSTEQRIRHTLSRSDFLSPRRGLVSTDDLRRVMPAPAAPVTLPPMPYAREVAQ